MTTPELKPKRGDRIRTFLDFVFGFENKKGEILDYWVAFHDSLSLSPQEFYEALEKEITARKIPGLTMSREEFAEGGILSDMRVYMRLFRERLAIYTCASPFGCGYFFSCRTVYVPALVRLWHILAALLFFLVMGIGLWLLLGFTFAVIAFLTLPFALAAVFKNAASAAISNLDNFFLRLPVVSTIYEDWFRAETWYRVDSRAFYIQRIPQVIKQLAEEMTAAKGAKLVKQYEYAPVFGELYKPRMPNPHAQ